MLIGRKIFLDYSLCRNSIYLYSFEILLTCVFRYLASGSGDTTVRFWDVNTETPQFTCKGKRLHLIILNETWNFGNCIHIYSACLCFFLNLAGLCKKTIS